MIEAKASSDAAGRRAWIVLAGIGVLFTAATALSLDRLIEADSQQFVLAVLVQAAIYIAAIWWIAQHGGRPRMFIVVVVAAIAARAVALAAPPYLSTDAYRYVWDGRVAAAGINPYRYVPADPALAKLRDDAIYPNINRRDYAPTIYPPAAQIIFLLATRFGETLLSIKIAMVGFEAIAALALAALLKRRGEPASRILIYAWHPLPIWEFAGTGHVDAAAIAFLCLALLAADSCRRGATGAALAAAALIKPFALAIAPALWRRWDWKMPAAALLTVLVLYAPFLGVGTKVIGFLGSYGGEEGYYDGSGFYVIALLRALGLPAPSGRIYSVAALMLFAVLSAAVALRPPSQGLRFADAILLASAFLFLTSPHYAWYFAWVIPLLCGATYVPLLFATLASFLNYLPRTTFLGSRLAVDSIIYGGFALLALGSFAAASARRRREG